METVQKNSKPAVGSVIFSPDETNIARFGYYTALASFIAALSFSIVQTAQILGIITYPVDAILIYATSACIAPAFLLAMLALHYVTPNEKNMLSHAALLFAVMYMVYVILNYAVQLAVIIPMPVAEAQTSVLNQTPHSLFWTIDALGYICMGIATLIAAFIFSKEGSGKWVRRFFLANGFVVPLISVVYFYPHFSTFLLILGFPWIVTTVGSLLALTLFFRRRYLESS